MSHRETNCTCLWKRKDLYPLSISFAIISESLSVSILHSCPYKFHRVEGCFHTVYKLHWKLFWYEIIVVRDTWKCSSDTKQWRWVLFLSHLLIYLCCCPVNILCTFSLLQLSSNNSFDCTFKNYYYSNLSGDEAEEVAPMKIQKPKQKRACNDISGFFEKPKKQKKIILSSCVAQSNPEGTSYISTNSDDGSQASHFIKIELYDTKKLNGLPATEYWKNAEVRLKYYVQSERNELYESLRDIIYNITKEIAGSSQCKKSYFAATKR